VKILCSLLAVASLSACSGKSAVPAQTETKIDVDAALSAETKSSALEYNRCMRQMLAKGRNKSSAEEECAGADAMAIDDVAEELRKSYPQLEQAKAEGLAEKYIEVRLSADEKNPNAPNN
jgi:hypothetical protein